MEREPTFQLQTDVFLRATNVAVCGNDYTATTRYGIRNLFAPPNATNGDPRPVFLAINCVSNSPSHAQYQVLICDFSNGGGAFDFTSLLTTTYRRILDSVQAPSPVLTAPQLNGNTFEFTFPGQRGRTNRVEGTTNFVDWSTVTNVFGTNAPIRVREPLEQPEKFYRVRRL
jgi:hypothetical protein